MERAAEFVERARQGLRDRRLSIRSAARALSYDHAYLSRVLAGKQEPSPQLVAALGKLLASGESDLADGRSYATTSVADFLPPGDPLAPLTSRTGRRIGNAEVSDVCGRVHALRLADDVVYGHDLIGPALRELRAAVRLYRESTHTDTVGRGLLYAIGELAQIVGWVASDAGQHAEAERIYRLGLSAAQSAEDGVLSAQLLGSLAYQLANVGDARQAVEMAESAATEAGDDAPSRARALFLDRLAWAHAKAGNTQPALRALAEAHEALRNNESDNEPTWTYWVSSDELEIMDARVYTELRRPLRAVPLLRRVLKQYDATHTREMALYLSWLGMALADANEPEEAATTTERVLSLSASGASERTAHRSSTLLLRLQEYRQVPEVASLLAAYPAR